MSSSESDPTAPFGTESPTAEEPALPDSPDEVVALDTDDGEVMFYDDRCHTAWISSTAAVSLADAR